MYARYLHSVHTSSTLIWYFNIMFTQDTNILYSIQLYMYLVLDYYIGSLYIPTVYTACGTHDQLIGLHESNFEVAMFMHL